MTSSKPSRSTLSGSEEGGELENEIRVNMVSLGCPKNLVDSEMILGKLGQEGFVLTPDAGEADVIVVNTCGFVESAKEESVNTILEACKLKQDAETEKKVVVTGCLGQRYGEELSREIPELDAIVGLGEYDDLGNALKGLFGKTDGGLYLQVSDPDKACNAEVGRFRLTPAHYGYLRISEGCDNPCTFCSIPAIRGRFRSKSIEMLEAEARELVESGASELVLISQDTTSYGVDIDGRFRLAELLRRLAAIDGVEWIRLLYAYPAYLTDEMIDAIAELPEVLNYIDIPLQHISEKMLRHMGRRMMETKTRDLLDRMRARIPGLMLRTTFIVGFPGEDDTEFGILRDFVRDFEFERMGVFPYSKEEGTPSAEFEDELPQELIDERLEELMLIQQEIAFRHNRQRAGEISEVIVDSAEEEREDPLEGAPFRAAIARSYGESPEIDPVVFITAPGAEPCEDEPPAAMPEGVLELSCEPPPPLPAAGERRTVEIIGGRGYDLLATIAGSGEHERKNAGR